MRRRLLYLPLALLLLSATVGAQAPVHLAGLINHYTATLDANGPWYIAGDWSVTIKGNSGRADVAIALSMVRELNEASRENGEVTVIANGLRITGSPDATTNGNTAFAGSTIQVDITGGNSVAHSNITVTFTGAAANHFGTAPLQGVVTAE
jgi:hypothetical protein